MKLGLGLGLTAQQGGASVSPAAAVEALLSGTADFAIDRTVTANLFQDAAGTVAVTSAADPVGRVNSQWGNTSYNWQQSTALNRPTYDGTGVAFDGVQHFFGAFSSLGFTAGVPAFFACERVQVSDLSVARRLWAFSTVTVTTVRLALLINADGSITLSVRRLDGGSAANISSAAAVITTATPYTVTCQADVNGAVTAKIWVNGTEVATGATPDAAGTFTAVNSGRMRDGVGIAAAPVDWFAGWKRKGVYAARAFSDTNRGTIESWVAA